MLGLSVVAEVGEFEAVAGLGRFILVPDLFFVCVGDNSFAVGVDSIIAGVDFFFEGVKEASFPDVDDFI